MKFKDIKAKAKELFSKWSVTIKAFLKHPIQYTKAYFQDFKELSREEKIRKILQAAVFAAVTVYAFYWVVALCFAFFIVSICVGSADYEVARAERAVWMVREYGGKESDYL